MGSAFSSCCGKKEAPQKFVGGGSEKNSAWRLFTYKELQTATNGFCDEYKLGEGGFGSVYWGKTTDGLQIAVKKLKAMSSKAEMEFAVEVEILGRARHKNLLGLRGYCVGAEQRLIVYDYMPNLSLLSHLHGQFAEDTRLDWKKRMNIIIGSAEGLVYLHHEADPRIIHRDIKASNVLLDSDFNPLVADFGFAKLIPDGVSHMTTRVKGTLGYLAPEYAMWGKVSESCDVYSFGILLIELVSGRKPIERLQGGVKRTITEWAEPLMASTSRLTEIVDPRLHGDFDVQQLRRVLHAAARAVQSEPDRRPTMNQVLDVIRGSAPAADPVKNAGRMKAGCRGPLDEEEAEGSTMSGSVVRLKSVNYGKELMDMDDDEEDEAEGEETMTSKGEDDFESRSMYGVFGAMEVQRMRDGYGRYGLGNSSRRTALRG